LAVLFSSAGRRVELINCFRADAARLGINLKTVAVDVDPALSAACQAADVSRKVPRCDRPDFISKLLEICAAEGVKLIVPTIDTELEVLAENRAAFAKIGVEVAVSSPEIVRMARNKRETSRFLAEAGIATPRTESLRDFKAHLAEWAFPVILKPSAGSSSIGIHILRDAAQLKSLELSSVDYVAQQLCEGKEFTVNMFFDAAGRLRSVVPHERLETRGGEVSKGVTRRVPALDAAARKMAAKLRGARGALCFQAIAAPDGSTWVFEINARFGGGFPLAHRAGACFSRWLLEEVVGLPSSTSEDWKEGTLMLRYEAAVFPEAGAA
jgi:carbamoyl-phosphate synthase large subunit